MRICPSLHRCSAFTPAGEIGLRFVFFAVEPGGENFSAVAGSNLGVKQGRVMVYHGVDAFVTKLVLGIHSRAVGRSYDQRMAFFSIWGAPYI